MALNILPTVIFFLPQPPILIRDFKQRKYEEGKGNLEPWFWFGVRVALQQKGNGWIAKIKFIKIGKRHVKKRPVVLFSIVWSSIKRDTNWGKLKSKKNPNEFFLSSNLSFPIWIKAKWGRNLRQGFRGNLQSILHSASVRQMPVKSRRHW